MTTELTKAAQQALEVLKSATSFMSKKARDQHPKTVARLERALTTYQPAQAVEVERDPTKIEQAMRQAYGEFDSFLVGGCKGEPPRMSIAFASGLFKTIVREQGLFFTAPQQATPATPEDMKVYDGIAADYFADTQQATPEPVPFSHAGHFYNLVRHALMDVKRPDACAHRLRLILDELAVLMGQPATPPQQAAGEPVGEHAATVAEVHMSRYTLEWNGKPYPEGTKLYTHPAPSVPEVAREALERIASWNEHPAMLGVDYGSNGVRDYYRKIARDALAAAQAKGGE